MKKNIIHAMIFLILVTGGVTSVLSYQYFKLHRIQEEAKNYPYFTKHHLSDSEMFVLHEVFETETIPLYQGEQVKYDRLDHGYIAIQPTEHTEKAITVMNYFLFDIDYERYARELAEEYGLSYEKRMTLEWFNNHMHEAVKIYRSLDANTLRDQESTQVLYDRINSKTRYTHHALSYVELESLYALFYIKTDPDGNDDTKNNIQDYSDLKLIAPDYAEGIVFVINHLLFSDASEENQKGIDKAKELGLSKENPITADWVLEHPREILEIKNGMYNYGALLHDREKVEQIYERETGEEL